MNKITLSISLKLLEFYFHKNYLKTCIQRRSLPTPLHTITTLSRNTTKTLSPLKSFPAMVTLRRIVRHLVKTSQGSSPTANDRPDPQRHCSNPARCHSTEQLAPTARPPLAAEPAPPPPVGNAIPGPLHSEQLRISAASRVKPAGVGATEIGSLAGGAKAGKARDDKGRGASPARGQK